MLTSLPLHPAQTLVFLEQSLSDIVHDALLSLSSRRLKYPCLTVSQVKLLSALFAGVDILSFDSKLHHWVECTLGFSGIRG